MANDEVKISAEKFAKTAIRGDVAGVAIGTLVALQEVSEALMAIVEGSEVKPHLKRLSDASIKLRDMVGDLIMDDDE